ncbi:hypothetical protein DERP_004242 [Dermatophagoides pteronyssinus]|uniref:Uncharacterized protein n=1 Tax=Dermatophagoides pteronyssinus TaxID=6956 RepID=A0ABQ8J8L9_DERPT|nr:hypothetical protein DERP_004242 [Dermatophagoides pteronyssinus]
MNNQAGTMFYNVRLSDCCLTENFHHYYPVYFIPVYYYLAYYEIYYFHNAQYENPFCLMLRVTSMLISICQPFPLDYNLN